MRFDRPPLNPNGGGKGAGTFAVVTDVRIETLAADKRLPAVAVGAVLRAGRRLVHKSDSCRQQFTREDKRAVVVGV
jgi:hypothetical protein